LIHHVSFWKEPLLELLISASAIELAFRGEERHRKDEKAIQDVFYFPSHHQDKERDKATNLDLFNIRHGSRKSTGVCMPFWRLFTHLEIGYSICVPRPLENEAR
jgi:hypothetical protein